MLGGAKVLAISFVVAFCATTTTSRAAMRDPPRNAETLFGVWDIGPSGPFDYRCKSRAGLIRPNMRVSASLPSLMSPPKPASSYPRDWTPTPCHRLPPIGVNQNRRPPTRVMTRELELLGGTYTSPAYLARMARRAPPTNVPRVPDPRQDPIAIYVQKKLRR